MLSCWDDFSKKFQIFSCNGAGSVCISMNFFIGRVLWATFVRSVCFGNDSEEEAIGYSFFSVNNAPCPVMLFASKVVPCAMVVLLYEVEKGISANWGV